MVLLTSPVPKATEEVVGKESVDGVPDYVDIDRLLYPKPGKVKEVNMSCIEEWLRDITDVLHEIHLFMFSEPCFIVDVGGDQVELVFLSQKPQ